MKEAFVSSPGPDRDDARTVIVGAGPAGLTAALDLGAPRPQGVVFEADDMVGGISRSVVLRGYRLDIGGHRFFTKAPEVEALWHEILGRRSARAASGCPASTTAAASSTIRCGR